ncbi:MAG: hypothetical protein DI588_02410 [Flavobacterium johnsoniae]|nr:MAG: hypothetical protein DI588_02410 [Flavobacterium johnsoniae]
MILDFRFLPTAYCLLPTAYCLLPTAYCLQKIKLPIKGIRKLYNWNMPGKIIIFPGMFIIG